MNMHSEDVIQRQGRRTVLGKRTRCSTVSSLGQPTFDRTPDSKSLRNVQPKVLQLGEGRSQQARNCHRSNADSTSETSSIASASEAPALCATGDASESYGASSDTGLGHETASDRPDIPGDETSSLSSSSSSSNSDDSGSSILNSSDLNMGDHKDSGSASGSDEIIDLPTRSKPRIDRKQALRQGEQLRYRLAAFLPQMAAANSFLHTELEDGRKDKYHIEDVDESTESYIEMVRHLAAVPSQCLGWC